MLDIENFSHYDDNDPKFITIIVWVGNQMIINVLDLCLRIAEELSCESEVKQNCMGTQPCCLLSTFVPHPTGSPGRNHRSQPLIFRNLLISYKDLKTIYISASDLGQVI